VCVNPKANGIRQPLYRMFERLIETPSGVAALGRHVGVAFEALVLHSLDASSPRLSSTSATVLSSGASDPSDVTVATSTALAWLEQETGEVWVKDLTGDAPSAKQELGGRLYQEILSVGLDKEGIFVGVWNGEAGQCPCSGHLVGTSFHV
jgi:hypothetical protein